MWRIQDFPANEVALRLKSEMFSSLLVSDSNQSRKPIKFDRWMETSKMYEPKVFDFKKVQSTNFVQTIHKFLNISLGTSQISIFYHSSFKRPCLLRSSSLLWSWTLCEAHKSKRSLTPTLLPLKKKNQENFHFYFALISFVSPFNFNESLNVIVTRRECLPQRIYSTLNVT